MIGAKQLFWVAVDWLRESYSEHRFFLERDVVWTVQKRLFGEIKRQGLPYRVFNDFPIQKGKRRGISADLVLLGPEDTVEVAAEFKYEPAHCRATRDIWDSKFSPSVVFWKSKKDPDVADDITRVQKFVKCGRAQYACSLFIDEGCYFKNREPHPDSRWESWNVGESSSEIHVLISEAKNHSKYSN